MINVCSSAWIERKPDWKGEAEMKCEKCRHFYRMMATKEGYNPFPYCHILEDTGRRPEPLTQKCFEPRGKGQATPEAVPMKIRFEKEAD